MSQSVYVLGAGGHAKVLIDSLLANHVKITGILDGQHEVGSRVLDVPIVGGDQYLEGMSPFDVCLVNGVGANPQVARRQRLFISMKKRNFQFCSITHPTAIIAKEVQVMEGCQVMAGVVLQTGAVLKRNVVVNSRASVDHDCWVSAHAFVGPGVVLCGDVFVGESAFIGAGSVVLPGVRIGEKAIIGAGSVVTQSVVSRQVIAGNPAKPIGINESDD